MNPVWIRSVDRDGRAFRIGDCDVASRRDRVGAFGGTVSGREGSNNRRVGIKSVRVRHCNVDRIAVTVDGCRARIAVSLTAF